ncbi:glycosyltransferase family 4 protein [Meiothermus granaticius]|uniref:Putative glycosyltransferase EpsD n=1 Tax=Meiothermus granaticius NBRC 107808 TaxID=1227551 RepID=A0A399F5C2_9DEIN|nr:glycosyltransferase family 4 protein [Meiothermus granaticius]RIH91967.1 putative glycosyltransferase EpsD [Meiothermus granaticius NBRC 107808]GEM87300.1 glycosyl transferase [Meiothermus granaticius NBRC 107808]
MIRRNRILIAITRAERGGAPKHVVDLIIGLREKYELCLAIGEEGYVVDEVRKAGVPVHIIPSLQRNISPLKDLRAIYSFSKLVKSFQPDLIHGHTFKAGMVSRLAGALNRVPVVYTPHGWSFMDRAPKVWQIAAPPIEWFLGLLTRKVICVSEDEYNLAVKRGVISATKLTVIHNGIGDDPHRARPGAHGDPTQIIMVARFAPPKAYGLLIRTVAGLEIPFKLLLVGEGPLEQEAKNLVLQLGLSDRVHFLGTRADIPQLLAQSHIMVLSTNWEGLPIILLEGMRAGLPIVATDVGGNREVIRDGETGLLVPAGSIEALRSALHKLIVSPPLREAMGKAGRLRYEKHFMLERQMQKTIALYESILNNESSK